MKLDAGNRVLYRHTVPGFSATFQAIAVNGKGDVAVATKALAVGVVAKVDARGNTVFVTAIRRECCGLPYEPGGGRA